MHSVKFVRYHPLAEGAILWRMQGHFSIALFSGLVIGGLFSIKTWEVNLPERTIIDSYLIVDGKNIYDINDVLEQKVPELVEFLDGTDRAPVTKRDPRLRRIINEYAVWVHLQAEDEKIALFSFPTEIQVREFLQGIFTMCDAFNIPREAALYCAPFHGDEDYAIQGMNLPILH